MITINPLQLWVLVTLIGVLSLLTVRFAWLYYGLKTWILINNMGLDPIVRLDREEVTRKDVTS